VTAFEPTSNGIEALHCVVPAAVPEVPVLVDQVTAVTPVLSLAVPLTLMDAAVLAMDDDDGELIVSVGGVVSGLPPEVGEVGVGDTGDSDWRITMSNCETRLTVSMAVIVIEFEPVTNGMPGMVHVVEP
jgi:hypothetical protein